MKLIASIILAESIDDYLQALLEKGYKNITKTKAPKDEFWKLPKSKQADRLFVAMKQLDTREVIKFGVEVIEDMIDDFLESARPGLHEDAAVQAAGKKLAASKSSQKPPSASETEEAAENSAGQDGQTEEPEAEKEGEPEGSEEMKEPTVDQSVIITKGVHKGEVHKFVGKTGSGLYKLKLVDVDADKIKYNGIGAAVKREDFKLVEGLMSQVIRAELKENKSPIASGDLVINSKADLKKIKKVVSH